MSNTNMSVYVTKQFFFDRPHILRALGKKEHAAMSKIGAYGRTIMRSMMKPARINSPHSRPGEPPRTQVTGLIRRMIRFGYHPFYHKGIVGPTKINVRPRKMRPAGGKTIPQLLDEGGFARAKEHFVIRDRVKKRIISYNSLAAIKIKKSKSFINDAKRPARKRRFHPMKMKAGLKKFEPRPFRALTMAKLLASPKLQSAWAVL